jgi:hypothetical protein
MIRFLLVVGWIVCGAFAYAIRFAYFQRKYPTLAQKDRRIDDMGAAMLFGLIFGPIALVIELFSSGFAEYGLKWR